MLKCGMIPGITFTFRGFMLFWNDIWNDAKNDEPNVLKCGMISWNNMYDLWFYAILERCKE